MSARTEALHRERVARSYARRGLKAAGTLTAVGRALPEPRAKATVGSYVTRTVQPELHRFFRVLVDAEPWRHEVMLEGIRIIHAMATGTDVRAEAIAEVTYRAAEFKRLIGQTPDDLIERACILWRQRHELNARETAAGEIGCESFEDALEREGWVQIELAETSRLLRELYGVDLPTEYRRRALQVVDS